MKLTAKTDYALRVLIYLLKNPGLVRIQDLSKFYNISHNHLRVVVNSLSQEGVIKTISGPRGGIRIEPKSLDLSVGTLIQKLEKLRIVECFDKKLNTCRIDGHCKLKPMLSKAANAFVSELNQYKIRDLMS